MLRKIVMVVCFCISATAWPAELITDPETVKKIFSNKTAYGKHLKRDEPGYNANFAPDGKLSRFTEQGEHHTGSRHIDAEGRHCVQWHHRGKQTFCRVIMAGFADGIYFRVRIKADKRIKLVKLNDFRDGDQIPKP